MKRFLVMLACGLLLTTGVAYAATTAPASGSASGSASASKAAVSASASASGSASGSASASGSQVDAVSTATMTSMQGAVLMTNKEVKDQIDTLLAGPNKDNREIYTIGTCANNVPLTSCMEFVYDPKAMVFVGMCDAGTQKLLEADANKNVSLSWYHELTPDEIAAGNNYFTISKGLQVTGTAAIYYGDDKEFSTYMMPYLQTISDIMPATDESVQGLAAMGAGCIVITPSVITVRNMEFMASGYNYMQIWRAGAADDAIEEGGISIDDAAALLGSSSASGASTSASAAASASASASASGSVK